MIEVGKADGNNIYVNISYLYSNGDGNLGYGSSVVYNYSEGGAYSVSL